MKRSFRLPSVGFLAFVVSTAPVGVRAGSWTEGFFQPAQKPHPSVVRVIATSANGASLGSGALVAVSQQHGLVVTNWHVVRDATGPIVVAFPDGFRTPAAVLRVDRDWDLAALAIWRPRVEPIPLAAQPPRPGEPLTIAGYGSGRYREVTGRCTQYVSPGANKPFEMVELSAGARQGDSGGPILNQRGELAGVLFGTSFGETTGSYCGRVRSFLLSVADEFQRLQPSPTQLAQAPSGPPAPPPLATPSQGPAPERVAGAPPAGPSPSGGRPAGPGDPAGTASSPAPAWQVPPAAIAGQPAMGPPDVSRPSGEPSLFDQARNFLAAIGVFAIFFHGLRLLVGARPD